MAQRPTTLNSMTHYSLTEDQQDVMEQDDVEMALREALQSTPADPAATRTGAAIQSGLLLPEAELRRLMEEPEPETKAEDQQQQDQQQQNDDEQYQEEQH